MIICARCSKENQDHYKFCLGCGAELSGTASGVRKETSAKAAVTPSAEADVATAPTKIDPSANRMTASDKIVSGEVACAKCGMANPKEFMFCGNCGNRLREAPPPTAPRVVTKRPTGAKMTGAGPRGKLSLIRPDGSEGGTVPLTEAECIFGRATGGIFASDGYLSPHHTRIVFVEDQIILEDLESLNGVFVKITKPERLESADIFRIGQELLRLDMIDPPTPLEDGTEVLGSPNPGYWGRVSLIIGPGVDGSAFPLMGDETIIGRERGDILFSDDGYVSGTHAKIAWDDGAAVLSDMGSSNGTFVRIKKPRPIGIGSFILMGQQLFRLDR